LSGWPDTLGGNSVVLAGFLPSASWPPVVFVRSFHSVSLPPLN